MKFRLVYIFLAALLGGLVTLNAQPFLGLGHNSKAWMVGGELQQHNDKGGSFWVNGLRLSFEDRADAKAWMEQQVGKRVIVTVRAE